MAGIAHTRMHAARVPSHRSRRDGEIAHPDRISPALEARSTYRPGGVGPRARSELESDRRAREPEQPGRAARCPGPWRVGRKSMWAVHAVTINISLTESAGGQLTRSPNDVAGRAPCFPSRRLRCRVPSPAPGGVSALLWKRATRKWGALRSGLQLNPLPNHRRSRGRTRPHSDVLGHQRPAALNGGRIDQAVRRISGERGGQ